MISCPKDHFTRKFLSPNQFLFDTNPSINKEWPPMVTGATSWKRKLGYSVNNLLFKNYTNLVLPLNWWIENTLRFECFRLFSVSTTKTNNTDINNTSMKKDNAARERWWISHPLWNQSSDSVASMYNDVAGRKRSFLINCFIRTTTKFLHYQQNWVCFWSLNSWKPSHWKG